MQFVLYLNSKILNITKHGAIFLGESLKSAQKPVALPILFCLGKQ